MIGKTLAHYKIVAKIGEGGMGEVFEAEDTRLGRRVALKVLPRDLMHDPDRKRRLEAEARAISSLNHPNICTLHDVGESDGTDYLVMELLKGETLESRLTRGPLPLRDALPIARQIGQALAAAHQQGIVHRDLKPGNVMLTKQGVKLLDFGLAKSVGASAVDDGVTRATGTLTGQGQIVGTLHYMSPEQLQGIDLDSRSDIFAFGAVLYEMLSGQRAFGGDSPASVIAILLKEDPRPLSELDRSTPPMLVDLTHRCLAKEPEERWQDAADIVHALDWIGGEAGGAGDPIQSAPSQPRRTMRTVAIVALTALVATATSTWWPEPDEPSAPLRKIPLPSIRLDADWANPATISPDARYIVYPDDGHLWIRDLTRADAVLIPETDDAQSPFWSPDSRTVAFGRDQRLWKYDVESGSRSVLTSIPESGRIVGGAWGPSDDIYLAVWRGGLYRTVESGGPAQAVLQADSLRVHDFHTPFFLPDGETLALWVHAREPEPDGVALLRPGRDELEMLLEEPAASNATFSPSGHLLYSVEFGEEAIWAVPFDAEALKVTGTPFLAVQGGQTPTVANDGTMVYFTSSFEQNLQMLRIPRDGSTPTPIGDPVVGWASPSFSPDGRYLIYSAWNDSWSVWQHDLERGARKRLWLDPESELLTATWLPDGRILLNRTLTVSRATIDVLDPLSGQIEHHGEGLNATVSPDGRTLIFGVDVGADMSLYTKDLGKGGPAVPLLELPGRVDHAVMSPNGHWFAYDSSRSGDWQVHLRRFPSGAEPVQVSVDGGRFPFWHPGGDTLFYSTEKGLMEVAVEWGSPPQLGAPRNVFDAAKLDVAFIDSWWDASPAAISPDASYFVVGRRSGEKGRQRMILVENWAREFEDVGDR